MMGFFYLFQREVVAAYGAEYFFSQLSTMFSTYYVNMSIFLAFAATFPNMQILLFFFLPIKVKILGMIYGIMLVYEFIVGYVDPSVTIANRFVIAASLLNFAVFFLTSRNMIHMSPKQVKRRQEFRREVKNHPRSRDINAPSAEGRRRAIRSWNFGSAPNATEIMNTARSICLPIPM